MLRAILDSASQAIITCGKNGEILASNSRTAEMFGYALDELVGQTVETLMPEALREGHARHRAGFTETPRVRPMGSGLDLLARRKDGTEFPVEISLSYVNSELYGLLAIAFVTDISQRKILEAQLLQSQKLEAVGRLAGGIAHDFNNLLTVISGYDSILLNRLSPQDPLRGYCEEIQKSAERAAALIRQLLAFSRKQVIQPKIVDLNTLLNETEKMLRRLIGEYIEMAFLHQKDVWNVRVDPGQMTQVVINLVINARDAIGSAGRIVLETANRTLDEEYAKTHLGVKPGQYVMLAVSDNGAGMDSETRKRIFEPFFTTKAEGAGTGLGLATVYGIVKQNGGDIWVYSEKGKGSTFKIYLPRAVDPLSDLEKAAESQAEGTETILVVEDEEGVRRMIGEVLRGRGFTVLEACDPVEAIQISHRHEGTIHLLLTDVVMPGSTGRQLADELAKSRPRMHVLYMSGYTENVVEHQGVLEPGVHFLGKPFTFQELLHKIGEVLPKQERSSGE